MQKQDEVVYLKDLNVFVMPKPDLSDPEQVDGLAKTVKRVGELEKWKKHHANRQRKYRK